MLSSRYVNNGQSLLKLNPLQREMKNQVEKKVDTCVYPFESISCAVCNGTSFETIAEKDRYGLHVPIRICVVCGLIQTNPRMTQEAYNQFYDTEYRNLYVGMDKCTDTFFDNQLARAGYIYRFIEECIPKLNDRQLTILEIGCGAGGILKYFKDHGHQVKGFDLGTQYLEYGREHHGLDLSFGTIGDYLDSKKPDLIIYSHVLEHVLHVNEELQKIRELITPDGYVYIEVPSVKNLVEPYNGDFMLYLQNAHVYHFSLTTLKNLLTKNGFQLVQGSERVQSLFKTSETTNFQPINDYVAAMKYLRKAEWLVKLKISLVMGLVFPYVRKGVERLKLTSRLRSLYTKCITKK